MTESLMKEILQFIYTGHVQILSEENAKELITAADYLFLPNLKKIAGRFLECSMTTSNCISTYHFAETYRCDELVTKAQTFMIESNFAIVTKSEEFLNLTSQEVEEWISSDEIVINAEEDIFGIILGWMAKDRKPRTGKFEELFRHVRLIFASRDFLLKELVTNDFVKQNESCMNRVTQAMNWFDDSTSCDPPSPKSPRKIFESQVLVAYGRNSVACYLPGEDKWYQLPEKVDGEVIQYDGKLYAIPRFLQNAEYYEPLCNRWTALEWSNGSELVEKFKRMGDGEPVTCILAANGEIYAVFGDTESNGETTFLKYSMESHSWQFLSFSFLDRKYGVCAVAVNRNIYVVGGEVASHGQRSWANGAARYVTVNNRWEEVALIQEARSFAFGAAANGKVYIAGGIGTGEKLLKSCEVYDEMTNEWCFIASLTIPRYWGSMVCVDGKLYVLGGRTVLHLSPWFEKQRCTVECYDWQKDKWRKKTTLPGLASKSDDGFLVDGYKAYSARLFKGILKVKFARGAPNQDCCIT